MLKRNVAFSSYFHCVFLDECWLVVMMADCDHNRFGFHVMWYEHLVAAGIPLSCVSSGSDLVGVSLTLSGP